MKVVPVVAACIVSKGWVLLAQRKTPKILAGKWEFPGGKVEESETPEEALRREIREELGIPIKIRNLLSARINVWTNTNFIVTFLATLDADVEVFARSTAVRFFTFSEVPCLDTVPGTVEALNAYLSIRYG